MVDHNTMTATQEAIMKLFNEDSPVYLQLRRHIEERILNGHLKDEEAIPSIRIMAKDYSINPLTVGNALSALIDAGILYKKRGVGIFVSPGARQLIIKIRSNDFISEKLEPILRMAKQLEIAEETIITTISKIYGGNDVR